MLNIRERAGRRKQTPLWSPESRSKRIRMLWLRLGRCDGWMGLLSSGGVDRELRYPHHSRRVVNLYSKSEAVKVPVTPNLYDLLEHPDRRFIQTGVGVGLQLLQACCDTVADYLRRIKFVDLLKNFAVNDYRVSH